jgi:hypothetical protein
VGNRTRSEVEIAYLEIIEEAMVRRGRIAQGLIVLVTPDLINLFLIYQNDDMGARKFLKSNLNELNPRAKTL